MEGRSEIPATTREWGWYRQDVRRLSRMRGMPVVDLSTAHRIGHVVDIFLDPNAGRLAALEVGPTRAFNQKRMDGRFVRRIGLQAIMTIAPAGREEFELPTDDRVVDVDTMIGLEVLAEDGDRVGFVSDVYMNPDTLSIDAFELRTPPFERLMRGQRLVLPDAMLLCSRDLMIVPAEGGRAAEVDPDIERLLARTPIQREDGMAATKLHDAPKRERVARSA